MKANPRSSLLVAAIVLLATGSACAERTHHTFHGWSPDESFYAYGRSGDDIIERPVVCLSDPAVPSSTWPKELAPPREGCSTLCESGSSCDAAIAKARWPGPRPPRAP
jgi:hypothetical protein